MTELIAKIRAQEAGESPSETVLMQRASELLELYAPEITARPKSINWRAMRERWGSCTSVDATIRISDRLKALQIRLSTALLGKTCQHCLEFRAVIEVMQVNRFMKEDVIKGVGNCKGARD